MAKKKSSKRSNVKKAPVKDTDVSNTEVLTAALSSIKQLVLLKVCRLCEAKDGPFLNIFDADKMTAKKIELVMPFGIAENDDLPHKICFRCSAKLEELHEFIQKCIRTQENLRKAVGNKITGTKTKHRELWEEKLHKSNISNDDLCDALIKKAMEGIKDITPNPMLDAMPLVEEKTLVPKKPTKKPPTVTKKEEQEQRDNTISVTSKTENVSELKKEDNSVITSKNLMIEKGDEPSVKRITRLNNEKKVDVTDAKVTKPVDVKEPPKPKSKINKPDAKVVEEPIFKEKGIRIKQSLQTTNFALEEIEKETPKADPETKPFDIMEHVSMIKVNGVGVLFQCKICNRNFLKKEVVMSHVCAKQGSAKIPGPKSIVPPEPPKVPQTVKYITMKVNKDSKPVENTKPVVLSEPINLDDDDDDTPLVAKKPKPKIGPASKVRRTENTTTANIESPLTPKHLESGSVAINVAPTVSPAVQSPSVQFPTIPSLNSRYKLMPGPNNTFTLVEEKISDLTASKEPNANNHLPINKVQTNKPTVKSIAGPKNRDSKPVPKPPTIVDNNVLNESKAEAADRPYPVGLIKSISAPNSQMPAHPVAFPTPAMKKQSYTVVQTGNPSKLLISTKPQPSPTEEEVPKKRQRKARNVQESESKKQPFSVTIEDNTPPANPSLFTFINVDPLLQPSYVLPTHNIIQESQITTSTSVSKQSEDKDSKYSCNLCNEKFSREKKLLAHIHSHYNKMDEEDQLRAEKNPGRKRGRK